MRHPAVLVAAVALWVALPGPLGPEAAVSGTHSGGTPNASAATRAATPEASDPASATQADIQEAPDPISPTQGAAPDAADPPSLDTDPRSAGPTTKHEPSPEVQSLRANVDRIIGGYGWPGSRWGVLAISLDVGDTLIAVNAAEPLAPASNVKLITTAAALHYLGPDYRFVTFLIADGPVADGVLDGDLILYGTGDPALSDRFHSSKTEVFELLTDQLLDSGIRTVKGRVVGDGTMFSGPSRPASWVRYDPNDAYVAPISALSFNENVVTLRIESGPLPGTPPVVHTIPETDAVVIDNGAVTVGDPFRSGLAIDRDEPNGPILVRGGLRVSSRDFWRVVTVSDPPLFAASQLDRTLRGRGVEIAGQPTSVVGPTESHVTATDLWAPALRAGGDLKVVAVHRSPPLIELLEVVNRESNNLFAEHVLLAIGRTVVDEGSFAGGAKAVTRFLTEEVGVTGRGTNIIDGSGLSPDNRVAPTTFVKLLEHSVSAPYWEAFWSTLPEAGNRRGLPRMYRSDAAGNLRAKTGTINRVSALSGLVRARSGERIVFSIISNDGRSRNGAKRLEDRIGIQLASFDRSFAGPAVAFVDESLTRSSAANRHTVVRGESLSTIASRYGLNLDALLEANPRLSPERIVPGQVLRIPSAG